MSTAILRRVSKVLCCAGLVLIVSNCANNAAPVENELTWQEAKADAQAMELEIAGLIPDDKVVRIDQDETGTLFSCSETQHTWDGSTTVVLRKGAKEEDLVKVIESHYQESRFTVETDYDIVGDYRVQLLSSDSAESYLVSAGWDADTIRISSGSPCFTLPDDVYPGGDF